jgi:hypothetical protein
LFYAYVGTITQGVNDLDVMAQMADAHVVVTDIDANKTLFEGTLARGKIKALTLKGKHVKVTSDVAVQVAVAPFEHYKAGYAEDHFGTGVEGTGLENDFLITTPGELWISSYFKDNAVTVADSEGKQVFSGTLGAGTVRGLVPGYGLFRVKSRKAVSVMAGSQACGADYSPAGGMFAADEALFEVIAQVREERKADAVRAPLVLGATTSAWKRSRSAPRLCRRSRRP